MSLDRACDAGQIPNSGRELAEQPGDAISVANCQDLESDANCQPCIYPCWSSGVERLDDVIEFIVVQVMARATERRNVILFVAR